MQVVGRARLELGNEVEVEAARLGRLAMDHQTPTANVIGQRCQPREHVLHQRSTKPKCFVVVVDAETREQSGGLGVSATTLAETSRRGSRCRRSRPTGNTGAHRGVLSGTNFGAGRERSLGELALNHPQISFLLHFEDSARSRPSLPGGWRLATPRSDGPIRGRAGFSYAAALLLHPAEPPPSIRAIAHAAQMSHGAVGEASKLLRESGLVLPSGEPQIPNLFWSLAAVWRPTPSPPLRRSRPQTTPTTSAPNSITSTIRVGASAVTSQLLLGEHPCSVPRRARGSGFPRRVMLDEPSGHSRSQLGTTAPPLLPCHPLPLSAAPDSSHRCPCSGHELDVCSMNS